MSQLRLLVKLHRQCMPSRLRLLVHVISEHVVVMRINREFLKAVCQVGSIEAWLPPGCSCNLLEHCDPFLVVVLHPAFNRRKSTIADWRVGVSHVEDGKGGICTMTSIERIHGHVGCT